MDIVRRKKNHKSATSHDVEEKKPSVEKFKVKKQASEAEIERDKRLIMWSGVTFFMLLIFFGWAFNFKQIIKSTEIKNKQDNEGLNLNELTDNFKETIKEVKNELGKLKEENILPLTTATSTATSTLEKFLLENHLTEASGSSTLDNAASTTISAAASSSSTIEELKEKILEIAK